ncbi:hypothetical protein R3P38DRAFT_2762399 [Favolaschia claudopus]|uniref:Uncharacterized protein n=1 Tax=Favolaschia claudopus TaxID=2862362 RepID=A0AAW0DL55_9AGAR
MTENATLILLRPVCIVCLAPPLGSLTYTSPFQGARALRPHPKLSAHGSSRRRSLPMLQANDAEAREMRNVFRGDVGRSASVQGKDEGKKTRRARSSTPSIPKARPAHAPPFRFPDQHRITGLDDVDANSEGSPISSTVAGGRSRSLSFHVRRRGSQELTPRYCSEGVLLVSKSGNTESGINWDPSNRRHHASLTVDSGVDLPRIPAAITPVSHTSEPPRPKNRQQLRSIVIATSSRTAEERAPESGKFPDYAPSALWREQGDLEARSVGLVESNGEGWRTGQRGTEEDVKVRASSKDRKEYTGKVEKGSVRVRESGKQHGYFEREEGEDEQEHSGRKGRG